MDGISAVILSLYWSKWRI